MRRSESPNKVKISKRVIEIFEYFEEHRGSARVMDIARRYGRPQSSTSELIRSLVEMGFLYKNRGSRTYIPTPRVAILGSSCQPELLRNSLLLPGLDQFAVRTRLGVALLGIVGTNTQVFRWAVGGNWTGKTIACGASVPLCDSVSGMLFLSTQEAERRNGLLHRLNAEASVDRKFNIAEMVARIKIFQEQRWASGISGFEQMADMVAVLLPGGITEHPLALAVLYDRDLKVSVSAVLDQINEFIGDCLRSSVGVIRADRQFITPMSANDSSKADIIHNRRIGTKIKLLDKTTALAER